MRLKCARDVLLSAVKLAALAVPARSSSPALRCIKLSASTSDACRVMATDLEVGVYTDVLASVESRGELVLPADLLLGVLQRTTATDLTVDGGILRCGPAEYHFDPIEPTGLDVPESLDTSPIEIETSILRQMIQRTVFAVAKEDSRYALTGVLWELEGRRFQLVATDTRRLAIDSTDLVGVYADRQRIVPAKAMRVLDRILGESPAQSARAWLSSDAIHVYTPVATLYSRLLEGRYPAYRQVLPGSPKVVVELTAGPFLVALKQTAIMADKELRRIECAINRRSLVMRARDQAGNKSRVEYPIANGGQAIKISVDPKYLADMLCVLDSDAKVTMEVVSDACPVVFRCGDDYTYAVMPMVGADADDTGDELESESESEAELAEADA
jgi:DNA polymerase-3 subunit beta